MLTLPESRIRYNIAYRRYETKVIMVTEADKLLKKCVKKSPSEAKNIINQQQALMAGVAIVKLRNQLGLSQRQFSKLVGIPHNTISRIENGDMNPSSKLLGRIAVKTNRQLKIEFV